MNEEAVNRRIKKLWKSLVGASVTALTLVGGLFGAYDFVRQRSRYDFSGEWNVVNTIQETTYRPYRGLKLGYTIRLSQDGRVIKGQGEKETENGVELPPTAHTNIDITNGTITGLIKETITADFTEKGKIRETEGTFYWTYQPKTDSLSGTFRSTAADASGSSVATRIQTPGN